MIFFANPERLWLLAIPVVLAFWEWVRRGHAVILPIDFRVRRKGLWLIALIHSANMLPALLLIFAILLFANPRTQSEPEVVKSHTNVQFVLDLSGSMKEQFGTQPTDGTVRRRIDAALDAIDRFVNHREGDAFGLTIYGTEFLHWLPLTSNTSAITNARPFLEPDMGATRTLTALAAATDVLVERAGGQRMIILITDGAFNREPDPLGQVADLVERFRANNIVCYGIFIRNSPVPDLELRLCEESGGGLFNVENELSDDSLYEVVDRIDAMTPILMRTTEPIPVEHYETFLWPAAGVLILHMLTLLGLRYTPW
ncbi:MAG: VWA domain-containing protein [Phycisphaera sp.]|nr:VWA domain-containing protein [Phycisphaera sp.]